MEETEEQQKEASLDSSKLSIQSEIDGQKRCLEILNDNANVPKYFREGGSFKSIKILGEQNKPEFIQFVNNNNNKKNTNDNVFGYQECFYHAVLRTIENEKGIKFIGKNIQRFAGTDLFDIACRSNIDRIYHCLFLIATLTSQSSEFEEQQQKINTCLRKMLLKPIDTIIIMNDSNNAIVNVQDDTTRYQKWLQAICENLDTIIEYFNSNDQKIINKFLCQLFFLIFFTNKVDIKPENILVEKNNNNVKFIHTDVSGCVNRRVANCRVACEGMFDTFDNHECFYWLFNKIFLKLLWKRISSDELSEYFTEYVEKYTLTEDKIKKIISRTVRNVFRSNNDINNGKPDNIPSDELKQTCRSSFGRMQKYMQYMLDTVIEEIELDDGDDKKKTTLINVLKQNCEVLNNVLAGHTIDDCVDSSIKKYQTLKQEILHPDERYNNNDKIQTRLEPEIQSTNKDDIINKTNNMQAKYNCWCIGDNDYVGCKTDGSGCGCFGCDIC